MRALAVVMLAGVLGACGKPPAPGTEQVPASEAADIERVIRQFKTQVSARDGAGLTRRGAHPKHHGCVRGEFVVHDDLASAHTHGLFRPGARYPALIRFSNNADPQPDHEPDVRGMAIKLFDVAGDKLFQPDNTATTQDFLLVSHPVFLFPDVATYAKAFAAFAADDALNFFFNPLDPHLRAFLIVRKMLARHGDLLALRWFSMVPYRFGDNQAVKYSARPCTVRASQPPPADGGAAEADPDFLRHRLETALAQASACFDFGVQVQLDGRTMPIEDPSVEWSERQSPFVSLARIVIPAQTFTEPARMAQCENLSYNPWRALPEHRPLGGISRARRVIYEQMSNYRHDRNKLPQREPRSPDLTP